MIVRLENGDLRDELRQPLYDTFTLVGGSGISGLVARFFSSVQGKTLAQTNLRQNGQLESAVSFRAQGLAFDAQNQRPENYGVVPMLIERSSLNLRIISKDYWQGPTRFAAGRLYANAALLAAAPTSIVIQQCGWAAVQGVNFGSRHAQDIGPVQNFEVTLTVDPLSAAGAPSDATLGTVAANTQIPLVVSLKGLLRRPVQ